MAKASKKIGFTWNTEKDSALRQRLKRHHTNVIIADVYEPEIGDKAPDGWIYCGISEDTGQRMYVAPADAGILTWDDALKKVEALKKQQHIDARLPSMKELNQIFNNRAKIGGFNETGSGDSCYMSSTPDEYASCTSLLNFSDGAPGHDLKILDYSIRFVRN